VAVDQGLLLFVKVLADRWSFPGFVAEFLHNFGERERECVVSVSPGNAWQILPTDFAGTNGPRAPRLPLAFGTGGVFDLAQSARR
jgi:hypothetical protein